MTPNKYRSGLLRAIPPVALTLWCVGVTAQPVPRVESDELIRRGEYLAIAGDCVACHTAPGGEPFAGGLALPTPIGEIVATNITPSKLHGIGNYTLAQFSAALRLGVRADGEHLYPAMPYTAYAKMTDDDIDALYAYFMQKVPAVDATPPLTSLPFPFNIRLSMIAWNLLFLDSKPFVPDPSKGEEWNRGAYLARGLTHCGTCHTPRNLLMSEDPSREYSGGEVMPWHAPNITSDATSGIGGWNNDELTAYLRLGRAANKAQAAGPMAEAVDHSLRHLTEEDLRAIAVYLKSVPAIRDPIDSRPPYAWGQAADELASIRGAVLPDDLNRMTGAQLYDAWCATCHQARGQGSFDGGLPPLFHNTALGSANTNNLVAVMLDGIVRQGESKDVIMPGFARELTDAQIATLAGYLVQHYGNPAAVVTAKQVSALREGSVSTSYLVLAARLLAIAVLIVIAALIFALVRHRHSRARLA
jgi:mono/diheme cytochrome c family protein